MRKYIALIAVMIAALLAGGCADDADVASENISKAADNFEVDRRIVFINSITDTTLLQIEGRCNIEDEPKQLEVTCKDDEDEYKKHFLGLSDNVTYVVEQLQPIDVSTSHYRVTFKPQALLPDIDLRGSTEDTYGSDETGQ